jgi:hypothetical protein
MKWRSRKRKSTTKVEPIVALEIGMDVVIRKTALVNGGKTGTIFRVEEPEFGQSVYRVGFLKAHKWMFVCYARDEIVEPKGMAWEGNALETAREISAGDREFKLTFNGQTWS